MTPLEQAARQALIAEFTNWVEFKRSNARVGLFKGRPFQEVAADVLAALAPAAPSLEQGEAVAFHVRPKGSTQPWAYAPSLDVLANPDDWEVRRLGVIASQPAAPVGQAEPTGWREALQFYADKRHFDLADPDAWDTVSGEPRNFWCDEAGTATVEDGSVAAMALAGTPLPEEDDSTPLPDQQAAGPGGRAVAMTSEIADRAAMLSNPMHTHSAPLDGKKD